MSIAFISRCLDTVPGNLGNRVRAFCSSRRGTKISKEYIGVDMKIVGVYLPSIPLSVWANFSIMMECTLESGRCHSVCTLCS
jgi:hypothetical protein